MHALYITIAGIAGFVVLLLLCGFALLWRTIRRATALVKTVKVEDVPFLAEECVRTFREKLDETLDFGDVEATGRTLDELLRTDSLVAAFCQRDFHWYFLKPVGAFVGESIRRKYGGEWHRQEGRAPMLVLKSPTGITIETHPFEKVLQYCASNRSETGVFVAYMGAAGAISRAEEG